MPALTTDDLIALGNRLTQHFISLGWTASWNFYGNDVIVEIVMNTTLREISERYCLPIHKWGNDSITITIWTEDGDNKDQCSIFIDDHARNRILDPSEEDINNIISKVEHKLY